MTTTLTVAEKLEAIEILIRARVNIDNAEFATLGHRFDALPFATREWACSSFEHGFKNLDRDYRYDEKEGKRVSYTFARKAGLDDADDKRSDMKTVDHLVAMARKDVEHDLLVAVAGTGASLNIKHHSLPPSGVRVVKINPRVSFTVEFEVMNHRYTPAKTETERKVVKWNEWAHGSSWRTRGSLELSPKMQADAMAAARKAIAEKGINRPEVEAMLAEAFPQAADKAAA